ncbi:hypothetical protein [Actinomadura kijaniata]|nr:hypothetical protein [Actinomadura kijaniata]
MGQLVTLLDLIAPHVDEPGYGGYVRETYDTIPKELIFQDGIHLPISI